MMGKIFRKSIILITFIFLIIAYPLYLSFSFYYNKLENFAQLGDSLNALFSGLAFLALIYTIYQQNTDMRNTKKEMQNQNFENHFFHLLKIHNNLVAKFREINILDDGKEHYMYGGEAISFFLDRFKEGGFTGFYRVDESLSKKEQMENAYRNKNIDAGTLKVNISLNLGHNNLKFIDNVYLMLKLIDKQLDLTIDEKKFYIDTVFAQITDKELVLIFYYTHAFNEGLKVLLEKFTFFENIDKQLLHNWQEEVKFYKEEAYGESSLALYL